MHILIPRDKGGVPNPWWLKTFSISFSKGKEFGKLLGIKKRPLLPMLRKIGGPKNGLNTKEKEFWSPNYCPNKPVIEKGKIKK